MTTEKRIPVAPDLFSETDEGPRLLGSRCASCRTPYFPKTPLCHNPACAGGRMEDARFGPRGTLWSWSIQNYAPPAPVRYDEPFVPYALGVVDLADGLRVVGRISTDDIEGLEVGAAVDLVLEPICHDDDGNEVITWKFRPL